MAEVVERAFERLRAAGLLPEDGAYLAAPLAQSTHFIGLTCHNQPCLLISTAPGRVQHFPPLRMRGLDVQFACPCRLTTPDGATDDRVLSTIVCTSVDAMEQRYFLHLASVMFR